MRGRQVRRCDLHRVRPLRGATFDRRAEFAGAAFTAVARFDRATFDRYAEFMGAIFSETPCSGT
ncbi:pentapeptide repeat-containing protein [Microbispora sp. NPDC046973]|uniref:pentapeptide repeat-containing protein n=1 Tax=Microbispora sp. NPDC046973 TaxID=3155022 RepID=UPI0033D3C7FE